MTDHPASTGIQNLNQYIDKRIGATMVDYVIIYGLTIFYIIQFGEPNGQGGYVITGTPALVPIGFWFLYIIGAEYFLRGTLGHKLFGLKIVALDGSLPSFKQVFKRRILDAFEISWCFGFIAFLASKRNSRCQRFGDQWAGTLVMAKKAEYPGSQFDFENK